MFYIKTKIADNLEIKVDLYGDEIYTKCGKCGKELEVDTETLEKVLKHGDLVSTTMYCDKCSKFIHKD